MISSQSAESLIALEDSSPDVLFETLESSDIRIWPLVRLPLSLTMTDVELNTIAVPKVLTKRQLIERTIARILPNGNSSFHVHDRKNVLFVVDGGTYRQTSAGRLNWLVDDFAKSIPDEAVVLQDRPIGMRAARSDRPLFANTYSFDHALGRVDWATKFAPLSEEDTRLVRSVTRQAFAKLNFPVASEQIAKTERRAIYRCARARHVNRQYERILDKVSPKIVVMQTGAYGDRSNVISLMKDRGILVIEPQHGWIGPAHTAYNFGAAMSTPEMKKCLPDVIMTFGEFWSSMIRFPTDTIAIGKPHLESMTSELVPADARNRDVLVVSSVYEPDKMMKFTLALRDALPSDWRVIFRPHPLERATAHRTYAALINEPRVALDEAADAYESLATVRAVFGVASTMLYEALAFGCSVFVIDSPLADLYAADSAFSERVSNGEDIVKAAIKLTSANADTSRDNNTSSQKLAGFWKPNAVDNFHALVEDALAAH